MNIDNYRKTAKENILKPASQLKINDFILTINGACKPNDLLDAVRMCTNGSNITRVVKIVDILHVTNEQFNKLTFAFTNEGGSQSDDLEDDVKIYHLTPAQINTFFDLATLVICDDNHYFIDAQGYTNIRYLHFPLSWIYMYASEIEENKKRDEEYEKERYNEYVSHRLELTNQCKEKYPYLQSISDAAVGSIKNDKIALSNLKLMLKTSFPNTKFSITNIRRSGYDYTIKWTDTTKHKDVKEVTEEFSRNYCIQAYEQDKYADGVVFENIFEELYGCIIGHLFLSHQPL